MGSLSAVDRRQLLEWRSDSGNDELFLLYSFIRDGASAPAFHDKCNNKGPTFTVVYSTQQSVYGGYTSQSWDSDTGYKKDELAFLYSLSLRNKRTSIKFPVKICENAIVCRSDTGPFFGNGDMLLFLNCLTPKDNIYTLNGSFTLGTSYEMFDKRLEDVTNGENTVTNLEVYTIRDISKMAPWTKEPPPPLTFEALGKLKKEIESFYPQSCHHVEKSNILLLGQTGAGKSSFVNNVDSVFKERISHRTSTASSDASTTTMYQVFGFVTRPARKTLGFQFYDTRGLDDIVGIYPQDISFFLDGYIPNGHVFNPCVPISSEIVRQFKEPPKLKDRIHCVCFMADVTTLHEISDTALKKIQMIQSEIRRKGVPLLILMTKMDKVLRWCEHDVTLLFKSSLVKQLVDQVAEMFGAQHNQVLPTINYESQRESSEAVNALTLYNVKQMLMAAEDFISGYKPNVENVTKAVPQLPEEGLSDACE